MGLSRRRLLAGSLGAAFALPGLRAGAEEALPAFGYEEHLLVPVRVHLLRAKASEELNTRLRAVDITRIFSKINAKIWSQAGIQLRLESLVDEPARGQEFYAALGENRTEAHLLRTRPEATLGAGLIHVYFIHQMSPNGIFMRRDGIFVKDTAFLRPIEGGLDEPLPRVTAHEVGHALTLPHRQDETNLMQSGTTGYLLNAQEVEQARASAAQFGGTFSVKDARTAVGLALADKKWETARSLLTSLAGIPVDSPEKAKAREQLAALPKAADAG